jgi:hypothetical protein
MVFLLAALGFERIRGWIPRRFPGRVGWAGGIALWTFVALMPPHYIAFGLRQRDLWNRSTGEVNFAVVQRVAAIAPAGSLVGTIEMGSTALLYSELIPFSPDKPGAAEAVARALGEGRRAFLLLEPWNAGREPFKGILERFHGREIERFPELWEGLPLYELTN